MDHEGRLAHDGPRAQNRMPEAERRRLAYVHARGPVREDAVQRIEQFLLALLLQHGFEFRIGVEMIFDRSLELPVMNTSVSAPADNASSTAYWMSGLSTIGSISFGSPW